MLQRPLLSVAACPPAVVLRPGPGFLRRPLPARVALLCGLLALNPSAPAQPQIFLNDIEYGAEPPVLGAAIEESPALENLFSRAREGVARGDWKFAIDSLQRIIEDETGGLVALDEASSGTYARYESARRRAMHELAQLPPDGLAAYRLLHDGRARRLLDRARDTGDSAAARELVSRYLLSSYGDDGCLLLAGWALDEGRPAETLTMLRLMREVLPEHAQDVPPADAAAAGRAAAMEAAALTLLGRGEEARRALERVQAGARAPWMASVTALQADVESNVTGSWPVRGGSPRRGGLMPAVEPTLMDIAQWQVELPGARADLWGRGPLASIVEDGVVPVAAPIAAAGLVFARSPSGVVAVEPEGMTVRWSAETARVEPSTVEDEIAFPNFDFSESGLGDEAATGSAAAEFSDHVLGSMSVCHELVLTVERDGGDASGGWSGLDRRTRRMMRMTGGFFPATYEPTRLVATRARSGEPAWQRGRSDDPSDPLGSVQFRAAPIEYGPHIWVPVLRGTDLLMAVLEPETGATVDEIVLCYVERVMASLEESLEPAAADGVVFVPTGQGLLVAIGGDDRRLRWATQYHKVSAHENDVLASRHEDVWLPGPPVAVGGRVFLAPTDAGALFAFAADSGEVLWSIPRPSSAAYVIGADAGRVWLGGSGITCVSARDGRVEWSAPLESAATGRAVVSGERILVPTMSGIEAVTAADGRKLLSQGISETQEPLGNLLAFDDAVFSLDPRALRKYPDLVQAYPRAVARLEAEPGNIAAAMRLAWLELLRREPRAGYEVLLKVDDSEYAEDRAHAVELSRIRVELLLALADEPGAAAEESMRLVEEAGRYARTSADRLRCGLRAGRALAEAGRYAESATRLYELATSDAADEMTIREDGVRAGSRLGVAEELARIVPRMTPEQHGAWRAAAEAGVVRAAVRLSERDGRREPKAALRRVSDMPQVGAPAQLALIALGKSELQETRFEQAEYFLRRAVAIDSDPALTAAAHMLLADLYAAPAIGLSSRLAECLDTLESRFASAKVPAAYVQVGSARDLSEDPASAEGIAAWVAKARGRVSREDARAERFDTIRPEIALDAGGAPESDGQAGLRQSAPRLVYVDEPRPAALGTRAVFYEQDDTLVCRDVRDFGRIVWRTELRLPEEFRPPIEQRLALWIDPRAYGTGRHLAAAEDQIMVIRGDRALHAVGLLSGKRLWTRAFDVPDSHPDLEDRDYALSLRGGFVAGTPRSGRLTVMRAVDGSTVWERDMRGGDAALLSIWEDRLLAVDEAEERVQLFRLADGVLIGQLLFSQLDPDGGVVSLIRVGDLLCGPAYRSDEESIVAYDLRTGEERWRRPAAGESAVVAQLFRPAPDTLGVGLLGGGVLLLEGATGEDIQSFKTGATGAVTDGTIAGSRVVLRWYETSRGVEYARLGGFDLSSGGELWRREDLAPLDYYDEPLRVYGEDRPVVPAMVDQRAFQSQGASGPFAMSLLAVESGEQVGVGIELIPGGGQSELVGDFGLWADGFVYNVGTDLRRHRVPRAGGRRRGGRNRDFMTAMGIDSTGDRVASAVRRCWALAALLLAVPAGVRGQEAGDATDLPNQPAPAAPAGAGGRLPPGVTPEIKAAIDKGLAYLARMQTRQGSWANSEGYGAYPVAMTALSGIAMLMDGNTTTQGRYAQQVDRAAKYLLESSGRSGLIERGEGEGRPMFGHGFSMLFLGELYGMTEDPRRQAQIHDVLARAIQLTDRAQSALGGWIYMPDSGGDEGSVTITQVQGLRSARNAGVTVPKKVIDQAMSYLEKSQNSDGGIRYSLSMGGGGSRPAITAAAVCCWFNAGEYESPLAKKSFEYAKQNVTPNRAIGGHFYYAHMYMAQAMWVSRDAGWDRYYREISDVILSQQGPDGSWEGDGAGRIYGTAVALIVLQLPFNQLPIMQR